MREQRGFTKLRVTVITRGNRVEAHAREHAVTFKLRRIKRKRHEARPQRRYRHVKLLRNFIAEGGGAGRRDRQPARGDDEFFRAQFADGCGHTKAIVTSDAFNLHRIHDAHVAALAFVDQHVDDLLR